MPIESESLPNDLRLGSKVAKMAKTTRKVKTNSTPKICHELSWSCATEMPNGPIPWWPVTDTLYLGTREEINNYKHQWGLTSRLIYSRVDERNANDLLVEILQMFGCERWLNSNSFSQPIICLTITLINNLHIKYSLRLSQS